MHKITNLWKFGLNWSSKLQENNERKNTLVAQIVCFQMLIKASGLKSFIFEWEITSFSKTVTSEGAVSHNVLYYQQLSIARYQVSFYANNYFE